VTRRATALQVFDALGVDKKAPAAEVIPPAKSKRQVGRQWKPGQSGNPNGRPKVPTEIKARLSQLGPKAVERLADLMNSDNERVALAAAQTLVERAYGKAKPAEDEKPRAGTGNSELDGRAFAALRMIADGQQDTIKELQAKLAAHAEVSVVSAEDGVRVTDDAEGAEEGE
jgi:hypothetical protein